MKKGNMNLYKKLSLGLGLVLISQIANAQTFKQSINQALTQYMVPVIALIVVMGVVFGLIKNWEEINDKHTRKQGLVNVGMILLYALIFVAAIGVVIVITNSLTIQI